LYSVTLDILGGSGPIECLPVGQMLFKKGEIATVLYEPLPTERFLYWAIGPYSHTGSYSPKESVGIYITDNTTATAVVTSNEHTLTLVCDTYAYRHGTVYLPNGDPLNYPNTAVLDVKYGDEITLTASPESGYYTEWNNNHLSSSSFRYENNVTLKITDDTTLKVYFKPGTKPTGPTGNVALVGGSATVYTAYGVPTGTISPKPFLADSIDHGGGFRALCETIAPHRITHWEWKDYNDVTRYSVWSTSFDRWSFLEIYISKDTTATAYWVEEVKLDIEIEGQGVVTSDDFLYAWNPLPYAANGGVDLLEKPMDNEVVMKHEACPGWSFDHWEVSDGAGGLEVVETSPGVPLTEELTVYMNWHEDPTHLNVPEGMTKYTVKAVFVADTTAEGELHSVTFTSDHGVLQDEDTTFADTGNPYPEPEWVA